MTEWQETHVDLVKGYHFSRSPRPNLNNRGVYILIGSGKSKRRLPRIYVGEGNVQNELALYGENKKNVKKFWTRAVAFIGKDRDLSKKLVERIEARLIKLAKEGKCCELKNKQSPKRRWYTKDQKYLDDILSCLTLEEQSFFGNPHAQSKKTQEIPIRRKNFVEKKSPDLNRSYRVLCLKSKGITAHGYELNTNFVVLKGSQAVKQEVDSIQRSTYDLRRKLIQSHKFKDSGRFYVLSEDHTFTSRSAASKALLGNANDGSGWENCQC